MSTIKIAEEHFFDGINAVISVNNKSDDIYKFPYFFGNCNEILPTKNQIIFISIEDKNVIAFLSLHNNDLFKSGSEAEFEMVVHPDYRDRKKHNGETLLRYVIEYAEKETKIIQLVAKVLMENLPPINLLKKCGFNYNKIENGEKGYVMKLELSR